MPAAVDARLRAALRAARHRRGSTPTRPRRSSRSQAGKQRGDRDADGQRQDALLQPAGARTCCCAIRRRARHVPVPHQGAGRRSAPRIPERGGRDGREIRAFTYDGDTPQDARKAIRQRANVVLTNPDMLHSGILPHHTRWAQLLRESALHRDRRAALLPRRLRQPSGQPAAPAAAHLRVLRLEAAVHLLLGHHRQSARTGRGADRRRRSSWWSATARRAARSSSSSTIRRW